MSISTKILPAAFATALLGAGAVQSQQNKPGWHSHPVGVALIGVTVASQLLVRPSSNRSTKEFA